MSNEAEIAKLKKAFEDRSGWERLSWEIDAWWVPQAGLFMQAHIVGHKVLKDDAGNDRLVFLMRNANDVKAKPVGSDTDAELEVMPAGSVIAVGETYALKEIRQYVTKRGLVQMKCLEKVKIGRRSMWRYDVVCKGDKAPLILDSDKAPVPSKRDEDAPSDLDDDMPF